MKRLPETPLEEALHWLDLAKSDFAFARLGIGRAEINQGHVAFHFQQTSEKAIKAVMISRRIVFPRIHNLTKLLEVAETSGVEIPEELRDMDVLNPYAVTARYGDLAQPIERDELDIGMRLAEATLRWAESVIGPPEPPAAED